MSRAVIVSFTLKGGELAESIRQVLVSEEETELFALKKYADINGQSPVSPDLKSWCEREWKESELMIFVGATGICVRTIAPFLKSKTTDPAVLVIDEAGNFVISLLSGHLGGANAWAEQIAGSLGSIPVITTATDVEGKFAVDVWAKKNHCRITSMKMAKKISAEILQGKTVLILSPDHEPEGQIPPECRWIGEDEIPDGQNGEEIPLLIYLSSGGRDPEYPSDRYLRLIPTDLTLGVGCRKGHPEETVSDMVREAMTEAGLRDEAVTALCSIDLKAEEGALIAEAEKRKIPFITFPADVLRQVEGEFTPSGFVSQITGVDNVCERSAMAGSGEESRLILRKRAKNGVTVACARKGWRIRF